MSEETNKDNSAFHFFIYLVSFLALGFVATGIGAILFQFINKFFPDALRYGSGHFSQEGIKYGIASIIVAGPLYLYLIALINKQLRQGKIQVASLVRKWLTFIILFITAAIIVIDLVTLIFNLLDGELVARFILKVIVVFIIAAAIFGYYFWEIRKKDLIGKKNRADKISFIALIAIMIIVLISSFFIVDSPTIARDKRVDQQTVNDLSSVYSSVQTYYHNNKELPEDLDSFISGQYYIPKSDIDSNISYEKLTDKTYRLCADFRRSILEDQEDKYGYMDSWPHQAGRVCFDKETENMTKEPMPLRID